MKRLLAAFLCALALPAHGASAARQNTGQIIIRFKDRGVARSASVSPARLARLSARAGRAMRHFRRMSGDGQVFRLSSRLPLEEVQALARRLAADPEVEYAEADARAFPARVPNDPNYASQWHYGLGSIEPAALNLPPAWDITTGSDTVVIAVLDTGIRPHNDFAPGRMLAGYDFITSSMTANDDALADSRDNNPSDPGDWITTSEDFGGDATYGDYFEDCGVGDSSWHGTHVAGTIGAASNNGASLSGVDWSAKILPLRVLGKCGGYTSDISDAITWAYGGTVAGVPANTNPARVINMSLTGSGSCPTVYQNAINAAVAAGAVVVVAAGNENVNASNTAPANCANTIAVGALQRNGGRATYSNFGAVVDISAPGGQTSPVSANGVLSLLNTGTKAPLADTTAYYQGTSMATPHVSGAIGLLLSVAPGMTPAQVRTAVVTSTRAFPTFTSNDCSVGVCGAGVLDAFKLVQSGLPVTAAPANIRVTGASATQIDWAWDAAPNALSYNVYYATDTATRIASGVGTTAFGFSLPANFATALSVRGVSVYGTEGPGGASPSTSTLALAVAGTPSALPHVSSITVSYTVCPAAPYDLSCSGYVLQASTASDFTGVLISSETPNRSLASLQVPGLTSNKQYFLRLGALNGVGVSSFTSAGSATTALPLVPPGAAAFTGIGRTAITFNWTSGGNATGTTYSADASTAADFTGTIFNQQGVNFFSAAYSGLWVNTTYYFRVRGVPGGPYLTGQLAVTLAAVPVTAVSTFTNMAEAGLTLNWTAGLNPAETKYLAQLSLSPTFATIDGASATLNAFADFTGLTPNATYYGRVAALNHAGTATSFLSLGSTVTLASPLAPAAEPFTGQAAGAFTARFLDPSNPPGTRYRVRVSTSVDFTTIAASSTTYNLWADFSGLGDNQIYFLAAAALNASGVASSTSAFFFPAAVSTVTLTALPGAVAQAGSTRTATALRMSWTAGSNAAQTAYTAQVSSEPAFETASIIVTSATANRYATFTGLLPNTSYYLRVSAVSAGPPNPDSAFAALGGASTLPLDPGLPASPLISVTYSSVTVRWIPLALSPPDASSKTCEGYRVDVSTDVDFNGTLYSSDVLDPTVSESGVAGLNWATTYYIRVSALSWDDGFASFTLLATTQTLSPHVAISTVDGSGLILRTTPTLPGLSRIDVLVPPGAFPTGTIVSINTSVEADLPAPRSNQGKIRSFGDGVGFSITAGGLQPAMPVKAVLFYNPLLLPAGTRARDLQLGRYDPAARQWTLLPTTVDTVNGQIVGSLDHFSFFAPFFVTAADDLAAVNVFPIPWEPESGGQFGAQSLTISNLPSESRVRIYTIGGELVWEGVGSTSGLLHWPGKNRFGRKAASGTYLLVIEGGGKRAIRRAVLLR